MGKDRGRTLFEIDLNLTGVSKYQISLLYRACYEFGRYMAAFEIMNFKTATEKRQFGPTHLILTLDLEI